MGQKNILFTFFLSEANLIELYCNIPNILLDNAHKVEISHSQDQVILLKKVNNGNYFILPSKNQNYLFPRRNNRHINPYEYETIKLLFYCQDYQVNTPQKLTLKQPAKVSATLNEEVWKLNERGILYFTIDSDLSESSKLPFPQDKSQEIQEQLEEKNTQFRLLEQEKTSLQSLLDESRIEYKKLLAKFKQSDRMHQEFISLIPKINKTLASEPSTLKNTDVELFIRTMFTGFEGGLLLIVIISLLGTSLISTGFWILILAGLIFSQYRQMIAKNHLLISALTTLIVILLFPSLRTWLPISSNLSKELTVFLLAILSSFLALAFIILYQLINKLMRTCF